MRPKPDIVRALGARIELSRSGKEFVGLCPFHNDRQPSLFVNREKCVYLCRACQAKGDVFDFVMAYDEVTFVQACKTLGVTEKRSTPHVLPNPVHLQTAELLAEWMNEQFTKLGTLCRQVSRQIPLLMPFGSESELVKELERKFQILSDMHDDFSNASFATELWAMREAIEGLTSEVDNDIELIEFPPLTDEYLARIKAAL